jgi:Ca2+-dependent lipid-binding protein
MDNTETYLRDIHRKTERIDHILQELHSQINRIEQYQDEHVAQQDQLDKVVNFVKKTQESLAIIILVLVFNGIGHYWGFGLAAIIFIICSLLYFFIINRPKKKKTTT